MANLRHGRSYERFAHHLQVKAFVQGITAATCGAIAAAVIILGRGALRDFPTALISLLSLGLLVKYRVPEPFLIGLAGAAGLLLIHFHFGFLAK